MTEFDTLLINHLELHKIYEDQKQSCEGRKTPETKKESLLSPKQKAEGNLLVRTVSRAVLFIVLGQFRASTS